MGLASIPAAPPPALEALGVTHFSSGNYGSTSKSVKVFAGIQVSKQGSEKSLLSHLGYPAGGGGLEVVVEELLELLELLELEDEVVVTTPLCILDFLFLN